MGATKSHSNRHLSQTLISLLFIIGISQNVVAQCPCSASKTITLPYSGAPKTLSYGTANDSLCIKGTGTFSSNITLSYNNNTGGPTLIVCSGTNMTMTGTLSESGPKKPGTIYNYGSVVFNDPSCCSLPGVSTSGSLSANNVTIYNYGYFEVSKDYYQTNTASFTNYAGSKFVVGRNLTLNDGTLTNSSTVTVGQTLAQNGSSVLTNNTNSTVTCDTLTIASTGAFSNYGLAKAASYMSFSGAGPRSVNNGLFVTKDLYITRGTFTSTGGCGAFIVSRTTTVTNSPGLSWSGNFAIRDSSFNTGSDNDMCTGTCPIYAAPGSSSLNSCSAFSTLPVKYGYIRGRQMNSNQVLVEWNSESENNNNYFIIQRSIDGNNFEDISKVSGSGTKTSFSNYSYVDNTHFTGFVFYRIKQVDYNNEYTLSDVVGVNCMTNSLLSLSIFPNPTHLNNTMNLYIQGLADSEEVLISIVDKMGASLFTKIYNSEINQLTLDLSKEVSLSKGMYYISASTKEKLLTEKLMIE